VKSQKYRQLPARSTSSGRQKNGPLAARAISTLHVLE